MIYCYFRRTKKACLSIIIPSKDACMQRALYLLCFMQQKHNWPINLFHKDAGFVALLYSSICDGIFEHRQKELFAPKMQEGGLFNDGVIHHLQKGMETLQSSCVEQKKRHFNIAWCYFYQTLSLLENINFFSKKFSKARQVIDRSLPCCTYILRRCRGKMERAFSSHVYLRHTISFTRKNANMHMCILTVVQSIMYFYKARELWRQTEWKEKTHGHTGAF